MDARSRYITGRQSAHLTFTLRKASPVRESERKKLDALPEVSVVSWEVREEICEPYRIKAVVSAPQAMSRKDILGQFAKFTIQPEDERDMRGFFGLVTRFESLSESRDGCTCRVVVRQLLATLDGPGNCATYQRKSSPDIIREVLERNDIRHWMDVEFQLRREHPEHAFRFQYNMGDWSYIQLEMEQAGLFCYTESNGKRETLVIADDIDGYRRAAIAVRDRPSTGLATFEESIYAFQASSRTVPESFVVADYNRENAWERLRDESSVQDDGSDCTMVGTPYVWGTHHDDLAGAKREALLRHEAARAHQVRYKAKSTVLAVRPGCVVEPDRPLEDSRWGVLVTRVVHRGARNESYRNTFRGIPADRPYRMAIDESRWPRIHGTLGATICSPNEYRYAYLTAKGEYVARIHADFGNWPKGGESVPLRLAKPFAGRNHTGLHLPALEGDEAILAFDGGDPNRPYIAGFHHNSQRPDLINSSRRRMSRNELRTQSGNKFWLDDWQGQEGVELSTEHSGRSQLNLGFIPDGELKQRGTGAELRTSAHLAGRGGAGVLLTAYDQPGGNGQVLDTTQTRAQLDEHARLADTLAQSADASTASPADVSAQRAISADLDEVKKPGVLVTGPGPVGIASGDGVQIAADGSIVATSKKGMHFSTLRQFTAAVGGVLSLFAQKGMKLITSAGDLVMQAQRGAAQLAAHEGVTVESVNGVVHVKSPKEIVLGVGGSYIRVKPDGIEMGTRGGILHRTSRLSKVGPAQMDLGGQAFAPVFVPFTTDCEVWRSKSNFTEEIALAPEPAKWENLANTGAVAAAPASDDAAVVKVVKAASEQAAPGIGAAVAVAAGEAAASDVPAVTNKTEDSPSFFGRISDLLDNSPINIKDPANAPKKKSGLKEYPKPVKLESAVPCNWKMTNFDQRVNITSETGRYHEYDISGAPVMEGENRKWCSSKFNSSFKIAYASDSKTLTATVVVALIPKLLIRVDRVTRQPLRDENKNYISVAYHTAENGANSRRSYEEQGLQVIDRDVKSVNASAYKQQIEGALNRGGYKLILNGCQKEGACGCRVSVRFCVNVHVVDERSATKLDANNTVKLFPVVERADAGNWGEVQYTYDSLGNRVKAIDLVKAHETGHLFNFPDEYWRAGGSVHSQYIKPDGDLDFELGKQSASRKSDVVWQIESSTNLMGYGALTPTATISPYYVEYIRRWFSKYTNKEWLVGI